MSTDHNFWRERTAEACTNRGPSAYQPDALPLGLTGSKRSKPAIRSLGGHGGHRCPCCQRPHDTQSSDARPAQRAVWTRVSVDLCLRHSHPPPPGVPSDRYTEREGSMCYTPTVTWPAKQILGEGACVCVCVGGGGGGTNFSSRHTEQRVLNTHKNKSRHYFRPTTHNLLCSIKMPVSRRGRNQQGCGHCGSATRLAGLGDTGTVS